jgi:hypothetical protein
MGPAINYHTEGHRAFLVEPDGSTYCEVVTLEGACPPATVAKELAHAVNASAMMLKALQAFQKASGGDFNGWHKNYEDAIAIARAAIAKATGDMA